VLSQRTCCTKINSNSYWNYALMFVLQILSCGNLMYSAVPVQAYNGDDYNGTRIVSRAYELRDAVSLFVHCF
jgi:hypothetical protein